jgi:hypothetical protein
VEGDDGQARSDAIARLQQIEDAECPVCGGQEWQRLGDLGNLLVTLPAATIHGDAVANGDEIGTLAAFPFSCTACGFVRMHACQVLVRLATQAGLEPPP